MRRLAKFQFCNEICFYDIPLQIGRVQENFFPTFLFILKLKEEHRRSYFLLRTNVMRIKNRVSLKK